jgi:hypothetical protein
MKVGRRRDDEAQSFFWDVSLLTKYLFLRMLCYFYSKIFEHSHKFMALRFN